jgi:hypothetical protein
VRSSGNRGARRFEGRNGRHDIDDRLRGKSWNRRAADVFDRTGQPRRERTEKGFAFLFKQERPRRVVLDDLNRLFARGHIDRRVRQKAGPYHHPSG